MYVKISIVGRLGADAQGSTYVTHSKNAAYLGWPLPRSCTFGVLAKPQVGRTHDTPTPKAPYHTWSAYKKKQPPIPHTPIPNHKPLSVHRHKNPPLDQQTTPTPADQPAPLHSPTPAAQSSEGNNPPPPLAPSGSPPQGLCSPGNLLPKARQSTSPHRPKKPKPTKHTHAPQKGSFCSGGAHAGPPIGQLFSFAGFRHWLVLMLAIAVCLACRLIIIPPK